MSLTLQESAQLLEQLVIVWCILQESAQLLEQLAKSDNLMMLTLAHLVSPAFLRLLQAR